jgi:hypothetical protein
VLTYLRRYFGSSQRSDKASDKIGVDSIKTLCHKFDLQEIGFKDFVRGGKVET